MLQLIGLELELYGLSFECALIVLARAHVKSVLGHKNIQSTVIYINLEQAVFATENDEFNVRVAANIEEASKLIEVGFEYVTDMDGKKLFRKRK